MSGNNKKAVLSREELKEIVRKRKKKKIIKVVSIVAAVIIVATVAGLLIWNAVRVKPIKRTKEQAKVVGQVGKYDVYYDELSYLVRIHKSDIEAKYGTINWAGGSDFANTCAGYVQDAVLEDIEKIYIVFTLCEKYGIDIDSKEINKAVNDQIKGIIKSDYDGKKKKYYAMLEEEGISDAYARLVCKASLLEEKLLYKLVEDGKYIEYGVKNMPDFVEYAKERDDFLRSTHVYYPKWTIGYLKDDTGHYVKDENGQAVTYLDDNRGKALSLAQEVASALSRIEDPEERYEAMQQCIGRCAYFVKGISIENSDAVYFTTGLMGEEYESAVASLDEYGASGVVETEDGYYVIMRLPKEDSYIDKYADDLLNKYQVAQLLLLKNELANKIEFKCDDIAALIKKELTK